MGPRRKSNKAQVQQGKAFVSEAYPVALSSSRDCQMSIALLRIRTTPPSFWSAQRDSL
jgi:hypothetical protein